MGKILDLEGRQGSVFFAATNNAEDRRTYHLSVQNLLIGLFLHHDMDEVLVCRHAAGFSYLNLLERVHIAYLGLQSVVIMREKMSADMGERIRNSDSDEDLRKAIERHEVLRSALENSLSVPVDLLNSFRTKYHLKIKRFKPSPLVLMKKSQIITSQTIDSLKIFPNFRKERIFKKFSEVQRVSTYLYH